MELAPLLPDDPVPLPLPPKVPDEPVLVEDDPAAVLEVVDVVVLMGLGF
jgi:hypothetical protein